MKGYSFNLDYLMNIFSDISLYFFFNFDEYIIFFAILVLLISAISFSRKIINLEKIQFNDIDDITSYSRLIDDELGVLRKQQDELNQVITGSKNKASSGNLTDEKLFNSTPYSQAVQLARRGYARQDIISLCSLTDSEAELILALHSKSTEAA